MQSGSKSRQRQKYEGDYYAWYYKQTPHEQARLKSLGLDHPEGDSQQLNCEDRSIEEDVFISADTLLFAVWAVLIFIACLCLTYRCDRGDSILFRCRCIGQFYLFHPAANHKRHGIPNRGSSVDRFCYCRDLHR